MADLKPLLAKVATGTPLSVGEARAAFDIMMSGEATPTQIGGFLMALRVRGETVDEILGAVTTMRSKMLGVKAPDGAIDIVGTGGDGTHTYNISTLASIIVAGCGVPVAKHGNRAQSSKSGTADALSALGVRLDITPEVTERCIKDAGIGFMFAQAHHTAMRFVGPSRVELGTRTIFNLLGPLSNPAGAKRQLLGVFSPHWLRPVAEVLRNLGSTSVWVVHGDGEHNAKALRAILDGAENAYRNVSVANAAAALVIAGKASDIRQGVSQATQSIESGAARAALDRLIAVSNG